MAKGGSNPQAESHVTTYKALSSACNLDLSTWTATTLLETIVSSPVFYLSPTTAFHPHTSKLILF